jgi:chemotaxis protein methyltransferase WspC
VCVERAPADAAAHALLGVVLAAQGRDAAAATHLRRALYLDPAHEESLLHLAVLLERSGDRSGAARLRQRARRAEAAR